MSARNFAALFFIFFTAIDAFMYENAFVELHFSFACSAAQSGHKKVQPISRYFVADPTGAFDSVQQRIPRTLAELAKFQAHGDKLLALAMIEKNESAHKQDGPAVARLYNFLSLGLYKNPKRTQAGGLVASLTVEVADAVRSSAPLWHVLYAIAFLISEIAISSFIFYFFTRSKQFYKESAGVTARRMQQRSRVSAASLPIRCTFSTQISTSSASCWRLTCRTVRFLVSSISNTEYRHM